VSAEHPPPPPARGVRRAPVHLATAAAAGLLTAWLWPGQADGGLRQVAGWDVGSVVFAGLAWLRIAGCGVKETRGLAAAEDPGRTMVSFLVLGASAFSLFAALVVLRGARHAAPAVRDVMVTGCLLAVAMAWVLTHTAYTLRYAHLFYRDDEEGVGGLEFPGAGRPCYLDFAYFAFTVGMCFQVSDVAVSSPQIRRAVLGHALLSFVYNTTILALALNLVVVMLS
jgi:uncharacterized membrane protein